MGLHIPQGNVQFLRFSLLLVLMVYFFQKCIRWVHKKLTVFPYGQYIVGIDSSLAFQRYSQVLCQCWDL